MTHFQYGNETQEHGLIFLILIFFFYRILSILTHTQGEKGEGFKKTNNSVFPKGPSNIDFHETISIRAE